MVQRPSSITHRSGYVSITPNDQSSDRLLEPQSCSAKLATTTGNIPRVAPLGRTSRQRRQSAEVLLGPPQAPTPSTRHFPITRTECRKNAGADLHAIALTLQKLRSNPTEKGGRRSFSLPQAGDRASHTAQFPAAVYISRAGTMFLPMCAILHMCKWPKSTDTSQLVSQHNIGRWSARNSCMTHMYAQTYRRMSARCAVSR